jgi:tRNA G18 (ribose-2'-O)-methylase SpoU
MGAVLQIPWTRIQDLETTAELLHHHGFSIICFALEDASTDLRTYAEQTRKADIKQALVFGSEGPGLTRSALNAADAIVRIPMHQGVDSLNVATAAGIVLWTLGKH